MEHETHESVLSVWLATFALMVGFCSYLLHLRGVFTAIFVLIGIQPMYK